MSRLTSPSHNSAQNPLDRALAASNNLIVAALIFGAAVNILYLAPSLFMLQVYDRVLLTGGLVTLGFVSLALLLALATLALLDLWRSRLMARIGLRLDRLMAPAILEASLRRGQRSGGPERLQMMRDFDTLRQTISGPAAAALMDVPWAPLYLVICALIHPVLGLVAALGGALLLAVAFVSERAQRRTIREASEVAPRVYAAQEADAANAATIRALGMRAVLVERQVRNRSTLNAVQVTSLFNAFGFSTATKFLRLALGSTVLGIGAWLAIERQISPGAMIAASILSSRALAPLEQIVATWRQIAQARNIYTEIGAALRQWGDSSAPRMQMPKPKGRLDVENVTLQMGEPERLVLNGVRFTCEPGKVFGIIGPSGAGKSTLARIVSGAISPSDGVVRLDETSFSDWNPDDLGRHIGYVPQELHLLAGTIAENIRRFAPRTDANQAELDAATIAAAKSAGAHELIARLPQGYDTPLGLSGAGLSLGQAQRVALARALFGDPSLLVLDEPNAHLDEAGEVALLNAIRAAKLRGASIVLVAHRASILTVADALMVLVEGRVQMIGPADEVISRQAAARAPAIRVAT